jgi:hypothetical protein
VEGDGAAGGGDDNDQGNDDDNEIEEIDHDLAKGSGRSAGQERGLQKLTNQLGAFLPLLGPGR